MQLPRATRRIVESARRAGLAIEVRQFPEGTKTAAEAAAAIGCDVAAIVKSLVFIVDGEALVALVPGDLRLDVDKLAKAVGGSSVRRASLEEVREATGYAAGGTPPLGYGRPLRMVADVRLGRHDPLWAAGGTPTTVFPIGYGDLLRVTGATEADVAIGPPS